jgi:phage gp16-like protein
MSQFFTGFMKKRKVVMPDGSVRHYENHEDEVGRALASSLKEPARSGFDKREHNRLLRQAALLKKQQQAQDKGVKNASLNPQDIKVVKKKALEKRHHHHQRENLAGWYEPDGRGLPAKE